jgi:hypothetical protein
MLKTTKRYVLNTNTVNNYGYRVLSEGIDRSDYDNNPIMLWMHYRPTGASKDEVLCVGNIKEIEIDADGVMTGQPYFDDTDPFAVILYNKYENGTYNMFSLCALPLEASVDDEDMLPGQTGPTITKSKLKEFSGVDIGGNAKAHGVVLCDVEGNEIQLSDQFVKSITHIKIQLNDMSKKLVEQLGTLLPELKLSDAFPDTEKTAALEGLITLADKQKNQIATLTTEKADAVSAKKVAEDEVVKLKGDTHTANIKTMLDAGETARKFLPAQRPHFAKLADLDFEGTKALLDSMQGSTTIESELNKLKDVNNDAELIKLSAMTYDQLYEIDGALAKLKAGDEAVYNQKLADKFPKK